MKLIICLMAMLITAKECDQRRTDLVSNNTTEVERTMIQESTLITYQATTRGFFLKLWIQGNSISITQDRNIKEVSKYRLSDSDINTIYKMMEAIDESSLENLKPPTTTFQYDAAAIATLTIKKADQSYMTPAFDHGKPPKPIAEIVNKMLSIKSEMEKQ